MWNGNATWTGIDRGYPYAVYAWLDVPRAPQRLPWVHDYSQVYAIASPNETLFVIYPTAPNQEPENITVGQYAERVMGAWAGFLNATTPFWRAYTGPQPFWRLLYAQVIVHVNLTRHTRIYSGVEGGVIGVWGWIRPPEEQRCYLGDRAAGCGIVDVTFEPGLYQYNIEENVKAWDRPSTRNLVVRLNASLPPAPKPVRDGHLDFYRWKETCEWCERWECDPSGYCYCAQWASTTREVREEPRWRKYTEVRELEHNASLYQKPWVPSAEDTVRVRVPYTYRGWEVWKEVVYGPWNNGDPPPGAYCYTHDVSPYKRVVFWDVRRSVKDAYAFAWLSAVHTAGSLGPPLPDYYEDGPAEEDGFTVINLLRGAEYGWECHWRVLSAYRPEWDLVPAANANMTELHRKYALYLLAQGEYANARADFVLSVAGEPPPIGPAQYAAEVLRGVRKAFNGVAFYPLPEPAPDSYHSFNLLLVCFRFDWANETVKAPASVVMEPGLEPWLFRFALADSRLSRLTAERLSAMWAWVFEHPPPPPPLEAGRFLPAPWPVPWNGWMPLPYNASPGAPLYYATFMGVPMWPVFGLAVAGAYVMAAWASLYPNVYIGLLMAIAALEALSALFAFPSAGVLLAKFVWQVLEDLAFWYQIRLLIKSRLFARVFKAAHPVRAAARRVVQRLYYKGYLKVSGRRRWELDRMLTPVGEMERGLERRVVRRLEEAAEKALRKIGESKVGQAVGEATKAVERAWSHARWEAAGAMWERAKEAGRRAWRIAQCHDVVCAAREVSARVDRWFDAKVAEAASKRPLSYLLFWAHFDPNGRRWAAALNTALYYGMLRRGQITGREFEELKNYRDYLIAVRLAERLKALRQASVEEAAEAAKEATERATAASLTAMSQLAEALRKGAAAEEVEKLLAEVYKPLAELHQGAFSKLAEIIAAALGEKKAPETPRELAELLVRKAADFLAVEPQIRRTWAEEWSYQLSFAGYAKALAARELEERLGELYLLTLAWDVARGRLERLGEAKAAVAVAKAKAETLAELREALARRGLEPREAEAFLKTATSRVKEDLSRVMEAFGVEISFIKLLKIDEERLAKALGEAGRAAKLAEAAVKAVEEAKASLSRIEAAGLGEAGARLLEAARRALEEVLRGGGEEAVRQFKAEAEAIRRGLSGEAEKSVRQLEERVAEVLQKAAERLEAVRREAYKRLREIAHDFLWVGRSEPLFTIALPGAEEALRAAERALRAFAEGADREAVLRQFREEVAKVKQQYAALGADVRHLEGIEREVASVLQRLERPSPVKAPEDAAAKAELVRRALAALSDDRTAKLALALYARGVDVDEALAARRAYEIVARGEHAGAVLEAEAAVKRLAEKAAELITALERYAEAKAAAELAREPYEAVRLFAGADRLRAELLAKAAEVREVAEAAKAAVMKVRAVEEALEKAPVGLKKSEARLPERPDLSVLAQAFKERVERLKTAGAERERLLAELRALAELLRQAPAEAVKKAFAEAGIEFRAGSVEKAEAFAEAWRLAEALNKFAAWAAAAKEYGELAREAEGAAHSLAKEMSNLREVLERRLEGRAYDNAVKAQIARVRAAEEHLRAAVEALKALERPPLEAARVEKTEAKTPRDAVLAVLVDLFKQKVEELREARGEEREKLLRQVRELASEVRQWPRELVAEAFKGADVYVRPGSVSVDKEAVEEARARLRELSAALGVESEKLMLWASVTHKAAEAVRRLREAEDVLRGHREIVEILNKGEVSDKELAKLRSELRELARALDLYPELAEFLRSPSFSADLAALARAAERLGLPEAVKFISAVEEARFAVDKHGFRRYYSEVYQEVLGTMTPAWQKALLKAPIGAHVVNAMGLDLAREVFARYDFLRQFGEALADISPYVPARLGLPVPVFDPALIGVVTPPKTYPEKLAKHIASWDDLGVQEGIRRFYKTDLGLKHRAVAEIAALGAKAVAFRRLAERLVKEGREGGDVYKQIAGLLIAARAAREELRIAALAEAAGAGQQAKLLRESAVRLYASAVGEAFRLARELPVYELAEGLRPLLGNKARLVLEGVKGEDKLRRALERLSAVIDLRELYRIYGEAYLARAMYAEYVYLSLSKGLRERPRAVEPGYAVEAARALEGPVAHQRRVVEDAVAAAVPDWLRQRLEELRGALQMADPATAPNYLKPYARGFGDFRSQFNAFVEEVRRVAEFSPAAKQVLITVAKYLAGDKRLEEYEGVRDWLPERDALAKYLGVRMLQVLREAEPARAPTVEHLERLPEAVKRAVAFEERVLVREGYYDERLRAVYKALGLEFVREHPSLAASGLEGAIETLAARHGLSAEEAVKALRELRNAPVDAVLEKARAAGEAVMEFLAEVAKTRILEEVTRRGAYYDADLAYREAKAVLERVEKIAAVKFSEGAAADVLIRLVDAERLREGLLSNEPVPLGVMAARDVETALALGHRFKIIPLNAEFLEGGVSRAERLYLVVHPALEEAVERLREQIAAELARSYYLELRHLGAAPPEIALKIPGVVGVREGDTLHLYVKDKVDELAKAAARALADGDKETAGRLLRRLRLVWLLVAKKYGVDLRGDEAVGYA
ncbi:hypothetical protein [Pyrobaculum aerophilum]|uniref:hypothetical protein n=1 Tax=Pyrobaculum aerophilum TaxID=13773 RepID=UPI0011C04A4D|nr:hypothetical protein [Pyrobaculum aerophilum]